MEFAELVELAGQRITELNKATSEAGTALKALEKKEAEVTKLFETLPQEVDRAFQLAINDAIAKGLETYGQSVVDAVESATDAVYARFDTIADLLLGTDWKTKKKNKPSVEELLLQDKRRKEALLDDVIKQSLSKKPF